MHVIDWKKHLNPQDRQTGALVCKGSALPCKLGCFALKAQIVGCLKQNKTRMRMLPHQHGLQALIDSFLRLLHR